MALSWTPALHAGPLSQSDGFVTRSGARLILAGKEFRCAGVNIYWLGLDENVGGISYPSHFRVLDALDTAKLMGANVVRAHTLGVSTGNALSIEPALGQFNDHAFEAIDFAIAEAGRRGLRLVIPLTDNYAYYHGGRHNFTDWRGVSVEQFYTNSQVIQDFEEYISHLLNHRNSITGVLLKEDPTVMAWETGNEIRPPSEWTATVTRFIKKTDPHHLVLDGHYGVDTASLSLESVDLVGAHFNGTAYPMTGAAVAQQVAKANGEKPFFIGEFDWNNHHKTGDLEGFLVGVAAEKGVAGATLWSLFSHRDDHGFVNHNDGFTLHYPGDDPQMRDRISKLTDFFHRVNEHDRAKFVPANPVITSVQNFTVMWRGTAGGATYDIERAASISGPWKKIASGLTDYDPPFVDTSHPEQAWYRVRARALDGTGGPFSQPQTSK